LRGVGSARSTDVEDSRAAGNLLITARELRSSGVARVLEQLPAHARVFLAFDCDGLDPSVFPAVSAVSPGGIGFGEAVDLVVGIGGRLVGAAITEFVPALDDDGRSALAAARLAALAAHVASPHR